jgi:hypothetical protein
MHVKALLKKAFFYTLLKSVRASNRARREAELKQRLIEVVPDIRSQYTGHTIAHDDACKLERMRCLNAFQVGLAQRAMQLVGRPNLNVVDIGDSAGTHLLYIKALSSQAIATLSVNLDPVAVAKIRAKGLQAICCRAENLGEHGIKADVFLSFQMLEHLLDPISFLRNLSEIDCEYFVVTVPYVARSRVGMRYVREHLPGNWSAEDVHIFELSPDDWDLIFRFAGWRVVHADRYLQYPPSGLLRLTRPLWRWYDFEGFYGVILEKDHTIASQYQSWVHRSLMPQSVAGHPSASAASQL